MCREVTGSPFDRHSGRSLPFLKDCNWQIEQGLLVVCSVTSKNNATIPELYCCNKYSIAKSQQWGMLTLELSSHLLEIPWHLYTTQSTSDWLFISQLTRGLLIDSYCDLPRQPFCWDAPISYCYRSLGWKPIQNHSISLYHRAEMQGMPHHSLW